MDSMQGMQVPDVERWSERVVVVRGLNPGPFTGPGTNTYLIGTGPAPLLLDTGDGRAEYIPLLERALRDECGASAPAEIVLTHVHPDHIGGNESLANMGAIIVAHDNVRLRMLTELRIPRRGGISYPQPPEGARPIITFSEAITFHLNGEEVRVFLVPPAHTDGDAFVYFAGSDVLHMGDVFRTNMYPIIDVYNGGSFSGMIDALEIGIGMSGPETKVIPGHGAGFTDREGVVEVLIMMLDIRERVTRMIAQGSTLDEVLAAEVTAAYDAKWGQVASWNADDLLPIVYNEFKGRD